MINNQPKIEIEALIKQLESFKINQEYKLELAKALMLAAAMGLRQQLHKIQVIERKIERLNKKLTK